MNFIPAASPAYYAPAEYRRLEADGQLFAFHFDCQFARLTKDEMKALDEACAKVREEGGDETLHRLQAVCKGWRFKVGEGDKAETRTADYSPAALDELENANPGFVAACNAAYFLSNLPREAAHYAAKN